MFFDVVQAAQYLLKLMSALILSCSSRDMEVRLDGTMVIVPGNNILLCNCRSTSAGVHSFTCMGRVERVITSGMKPLGGEETKRSLTACETDV